jgi:hypothetical protein
MLAGVIAATENSECLNQFVHLGGLCSLDDWLQEAHKGKLGGDGGSLKDCDKVVEDLLLALLRALDRLPVDLKALKTCYVGKSVNHFRSHKNVDIQKKARKLVDVWKKRVDAEMNASSEAKPGSVGPFDDKSTSDCDPKGKRRQQHQTSTTQSHGCRSVFQIVPIYHLMQEMTRGLIVNNLCCGIV